MTSPRQLSPNHRGPGHIRWSHLDFVERGVREGNLASFGDEGGAWIVGDARNTERRPKVGHDSLGAERQRRRLDGLDEQGTYLLRDALGVVKATAEPPRTANPD